MIFIFILLNLVFSEDVQCSYGEIFNSTSGQCENCPEGLGIDPKSQTCIPCNTESNYGIDLITGYCILCTGNDRIIDPVTKKCRCTDKKGFLTSKGECVICSEYYKPYGCIDPKTHLCRSSDRYKHEGIDRDTNICKICEDDEGINPYDGFCEQCPDTSKPGSDYYKCECENGFGIDKNNKCSKCEGTEGINFNTKHCEKCDFGYGINNETRYCEYCSPYSNRCIDNFTGNCVEITDGLTTDSYTYICKCQNNFGFDPETKQCIDCRAQNKAVHFITGECIDCPSDHMIDEETNLCICPNKKGFDSEYKNCIDCNVGIDRQTRQCRNSWGPSECVDRITGFWVISTENQQQNSNNLCTCIDNYGFNYSTKQCEKCPDGQFADLITNECSECTGPGMGSLYGECKKCSESGATVDPETQKCVCGEKEGFWPWGNMYCHVCYTYMNGYGIDPDTGKCMNCKSLPNHCIDKKTGICIEMQDGFMADPFTFVCRCQNNLGFDPESNQCIDCKSQNKAIHFITEECFDCPSDHIVDEETNFCICPDKKGFDSQYNCVDCRNGIDQGTRECRDHWSSNECIDRLSGFWVPLVENQQQNSNNLCTCIDGYGFNYTTKLCVKCEVGHFTDLITNECIDCTGPGMGNIEGQCRNCTKIGATVDPNTLKCTCGEKEGFWENGDDIECRVCYSDGNRYGIDKETGKCVYCPSYSNKCIDQDTGECRMLQENEGSDGGQNFCFQCTGGQILNPNTNKCECAEGLGFDLISKTCIDCTLNGFAIDLFTGKCNRCSGPDKEIDPKTKKCMCTGGYGYYEFYSSMVDEGNYYCTNCSTLNMGYDPETGKCVECDVFKGEGIDPITGQCRKCNDNEGINDKTRYCEICKFGTAPNNDHRCRCPIGQGITKDSRCGKCDFGEGIDYYGYCTICEKKDGIDPETRNCQYWYESSGKCINQTNNELIIIPNGLIANSRGYCSCPNNFGFDPLTGNCVNCRDNNQGINWLTGFCMPCGDNQNIDENNTCNCPINKGFDEEYKHCVDCIENEGIDDYTRKCRGYDIYEAECIDKKTRNWIKYYNINGFRNKETNICDCYSYSYFNELTGKCEDCPDDGYYNPIKKECTVCPLGLAINYKTGECEECPSDQKYDYEKKKCSCIPKGFDSDYNCIDCPFGYGINMDSGKCQICEIASCIEPNLNICIPLSAGVIRDPITNKCKCANGLGYTGDIMFSNCHVCSFDETLNPTTMKCEKCNENEGMDLITGGCRKCSHDGEVLDEATNYCVCQDKKGYDSNHNCIDCPKGQGIDPVNFQCTQCQENQCIDRVSQKCKLISEGLRVEQNTNLCMCDTGFGFNEVTNKCEVCDDGYGIDSITNLCKVCESNEGIDPNTKICRQCNRNDEMLDEKTKYCTCQDKKGYDANHNCIDCPIGQGINSNDLKCIECPENHCVDRVSKKCKTISEGQKLEATTNFCTCDTGFGFNEKTNKCEVCDDGYGIDPATNLCGHCNPGQGIIDKETLLCGTCPPNKGINQSSGFCVECDVGQGISQQTKICGKCPIREGINSTTKLCQECDNLKGEGINSTTRICEICEKGQGIDVTSGECTICPQGSEVNSITHLCECPKNTGFDPETNKCISCKETEGIDPETKICGPCKDNYGIDSSSGICIKCKDGEGINMKTRICGKCETGNGIDSYTGECTKCKEGQIVDTKTQKCICSNKEGFDPVSHECINCLEQYGIDPITHECIHCINDQCIDQNTGICISFPDNQTKNSATYICQCINGFGYNPTTDKCERCPVGQGIDPITRKCTKCNNGEGINPITLMCGKCPSGQGIDPTNNTCIVCREGEGINQATQKCGKCSSNERIDPTTHVCGSCRNGFGIDSSSAYCKECSVSMCSICTSNYSYCTFCKGSYAAKDGICINDNIEAVNPPSEPIKETIKYTTNNTDNLIIIEKPYDASANKNYELTITPNEDKKTIVIEDLNKAKVELSIDSKIKNLTIQPNSNTPLEIVVSFSENDNNGNNDQPVITIDTESARNADTSLKGEGELILQSKKERAELNLNQIVPKKDSLIKIQSDSQVKVKQIDLYGNSKVEFTNKQEKAVVNLVTLQQKATTELDNVVIDGTLKAGLLSMISLTENVNIANTNIEISSSNETLNSNPILIGNLRSPPKQISIQDRKLGSLLDDNVFVIAESDKSKFECNEWAKKFVPSSSDSKYNHASCIDADNNMKRLVADHKDKKDSKGLNGGAIAGIVIAVIVVVAVIIILVYFFVIRKKKSNSQNEDDSFSSGEKDGI